MTATLLRRRGLGRGSCNGMAKASNGRLRPLRVEKGDAMWVPDGFIVFRWGVTNTIRGNAIVINDHWAIHRVADKRAFRLRLAEAGLTMRTWGAMEDLLGEGWRGDPVVVRPARHAQGKHVYRVDTVTDLRSAVERCGPSHYISSFIPKVAEYRVFVYQGRVVWVAQKTPGNPEDVAWNVAKGGRFDNVRWGSWPPQVIRHALAAMHLSCLDFGGVDVMVDGDGGCYVLEINSAPSQTSPYRQQCVAAAFCYSLDHPVEGWAYPPVDADAQGWRPFIHPGVLNQPGTINQ